MIPPEALQNLSDPPFIIKTVELASVFEADISIIFITFMLLIRNLADNFPYFHTARKSSIICG